MTLENAKKIDNVLSTYGIEFTTDELHNVINEIYSLVPKQVNIIKEVGYEPNNHKRVYIMRVECPTCRKQWICSTDDAEYDSLCTHCGQKLDWDKFKKIRDDKDIKDFKVRNYG